MKKSAGGGRKRTRSREGSQEEEDGRGKEEERRSRGRLTASFCDSSEESWTGGRWQVGMTPLEPRIAACGDLGCAILVLGTVPGIT